jgi:asparagine synthase (glutamine-hydrolysing)
MCGLVGYWLSNPASRLNIEARAVVLDGMLSRIQHRGPNDAGFWVDNGVGLAIAHRRLSILDLTPAGHQPMASPCGRYILSYNGEIYNHGDLRNELDREGGGFYWRGYSDTETLLAGLRHWGIEKCLEKLNGMFAFAFWDSLEKQLVLARDRMGEKPLYYGRSGDTFLFGSELKALATHPSWSGQVNREALALFFQYCYVPAPFSIYTGISKLLPAHYVVIRNQGREISEPHCYWNPYRIAEQGATGAGREAAELIEELDALLRDSISRRMMADVPLGAFLSGGYDSSTVAALMQVQSNRPAKTFSIGFSEDTFNEAPYAKAVAAHLGTDHTELYVSPKEAIAVIPRLPEIYDEPFADSSQIPTFLVSQLARQHVTVALSGDGGDELFCGYNRYLMGYNFWRRLRFLSPSARKGISWLLRNAPSSLLDTLQRQLPKQFQVSSLPDRLPKLADVLAHQDAAGFYASLVSSAKPITEGWVIGASNSASMSGLAVTSNFSDFRDQMMHWDQMTYLPDDILVKVDRASMAVGLEARVPLLDHRLVEFAWRVPIGFKYREGQGKWLLRQVLHRYVPKNLMERPKMGFGVPIEHWLRGPLKEWATLLLDEQRLKKEGFLNAAPIKKMWQEHLASKRRWHYQLWNVLMFQAWLEHTKI